MKKVFIIPLVTLIASIIFIQCDKFESIEFWNNTNYSVHFYFNNNYPDTLLPKNRDIHMIGQKSNTSYSYTSMREWRYVFKEYPKDTLSIFVIHTDTLNKYPWEKVRDEYKILKRYDLSLQDIERLNYNVPYPPSPEMANMKMYPKYGK